MMFLKRFAHRGRSAIVGIVLLSMVLVACGVQTAKPTTIPTTGSGSTAKYNFIVMIDQGAPEQYPNFFGTAKKMFEDTHPGATLIYREVPFDRLKDTLALQISQGQGPDVSSGIGAESEMFFRGETEDVTDVIKSWPDYQYYPEVARNGTIYFGPGPSHGKYDGISIMVGTPLLMYNKTFVKAAGIDKIPETWTEFEAALDKVQKANLQSPAGKVFPFIIPTYRFYPLAFPFSNGCEEVSSDGTKVTINSDPCVQGFVWLQGLISKKYVPVPDAQTDAATIGQAFMNKRAVFAVGMLNVGSDAYKAGIDVGYAPLPIANVNAVTGGGGYNFVVLKSSKHIQAANDFLHIIVSNEVAYAGATEGAGPTMTNADMSIFTKVAPQYQFWPEQLQAFKGARQPVLENPWWDAAGGDAVQSSIEAILIQNADPKTELDKLANTLQTTLDKAIAGK